MKRNLALRRLSDLAEHGELRDHLYPAESRAPRFARILQALDGALAGARHRDIAVSLFGVNLTRAAIFGVPRRGR